MMSIIEIVSPGAGGIGSQRKNAFCALSDLRNESCVEQFLVIRLLWALQWDDRNIRTKETISEIDIPRGSKKEPYRPDYVLEVDGIPRVVVEDKDPEIDLDKFLYQPAGYCAMINRKFQGENPVGLFVLTNGLVTRVYKWDEEVPILEIGFDDLRQETKQYQQLTKLLSYDAVRRESRKKGSPLTIHVFRKPGLAQLKNLFDVCHDLIWKNEKRSPSSAFYEFVKIIFVKLDCDKRLREDKRLSELVKAGEPLPADEVVFSVKWIEREERVTPNPVDSTLFSQLRNRLEHEILDRKKKRIFAKDEHLQLQSETVKEVVRLLEHHDLYGMDEDLNGRMFETFLNTTVRGPDIGQFFTPRSVVKFMVNLADLRVGRDHTDSVIDACCGSGGFLIECMAFMQEQVDRNASLTNTERSGMMRTLRNDRLFGIDAASDPPIARIARINMYLHGDGGSRIYFIDGLDKTVSVGSAEDPELRAEREELQYLLLKNNLLFDVAMTNPPFAMAHRWKEKRDREILEKYEITFENHTRKPHSSLRSGVLFLERYHDLLKPGGKLLIVIEDGILNGKSNQFIRDWLMERFIVRAVISLPKNAFTNADSNVRTSVVYLIKKTRPDEQQPAPFYAMSHNVGHDDAGRSTPARNDLYEEKDGIVLADKGIMGDFRKFLRGDLPSPVTPEMLSGRLDSHHISPRRAEIRKKWEDAGLTVKPLGELVEVVRNSISPRSFPEEEFVWAGLRSDGTLIPREVRKGSEFHYETMYRLHAGDLVASGLDIMRGLVAVVPESMGGSLVSKEFFVLRPKAGFHPKLVWHLMRTDYARSEFECYITGSTGRTRVLWEDIRSVELALPPKEEMDRINAMLVASEEGIAESMKNELGALSRAKRFYG